MLVQHFVQCPHVGCDWSGDLVGSETPNRGPSRTPSVSIIEFQCPVCLQHWQARVIGADVEALPFDDSREDVDFANWPPLELGVGD